ncbi:hypothetical protein MCOR25_004519 [Pyricularia grisea]|uniref:Uncharacterized protein n=1 Tax=Pyricularia grisea TaxID=148305 RepID=A0A6P8B660_PYRGI|nr:hypothetical protein PgNI_05621 [Pyricularia grisea]KAI6368913.1 hypothetical protein MCOR25_004519 [Pyricularia grisea]TLD10609.1 hypothetical protein PgNI_05621 [Pyricularia grisea]
MATIPQLHPKLSLHLADRSLTPLISTSRTLASGAGGGSSSSSPDEQQKKQDALASLTSTALTIHDAALHFGLGRPQRVLVDYGGPVMIQTFLDPAALRDEHHSALPPVAATTNPQAMAATAAGPPGGGGGGGGGATHLMPHRPLPHRGLSASSIRSAFSRPSSSNTTGQRSQMDGDGFRVNGSSAASQAERAAYYGGQDFSKPVAAAAKNGHAADYDDDDEHEHHDSNDDGDSMDSHKEDEDADAPPMLVGIVLSASVEEATDARRATARLEKIGCEIQRRWSAE